MTLWSGRPCANNVLSEQSLGKRPEKCLYTSMRNLKLQNCYFAQGMPPISSTFAEQ